MAASGLFLKIIWTLNAIKSEPIFVEDHVWSTFSKFFESNFRPPTYIDEYGIKVIASKFCFL